MKLLLQMMNESEPFFRYFPHILYSSFFAYFYPSYDHNRTTLFQHALYDPIYDSIAFLARFTFQYHHKFMQLQYPAMS